MAYSQRKKKYFDLSTQIAKIDNEKLRFLLEKSESNHGWGLNQTVLIGKSKVFVKRIPVTDLEYINMFSTKNLYDLPTYYNYGVGSAGFGAFRELLTHIKTTNWVLSEQIKNFPLMYHYRIVPKSQNSEDFDFQKHDDYVKYWNDSKNIGKYMLERANAQFELVLFLEHIPFTFASWISENPQKIPKMLGSLKLTTDFLRKNKIIHFDAHFYNIVTDGKQVYLTDFGLVLDKNFMLSKEEKMFFDQHVYYDYGEILANVGYMIFEIYEKISSDNKKIIEEKYGIKEDKSNLLLNVIQDIEKIHTDNIFKLDKNYVSTFLKYCLIIKLMDEFYKNMRENHLKNTQLPFGKLRKLLRETGFLK
jgi:hypothetical protein